MEQYETIACELVEPGIDRCFLGERTACRYCGTIDASAFGRWTNAHTFPEALGNKALFSLDECKKCNNLFSRYEDALVMAIGPFLTLGGVKGKRGVRQTGSSKSSASIRHSSDEGGRRISVTLNGTPDELVKIDPQTDRIKIRLPIKGDRFIPRYAYKALLKIAISLLPKEELPNFSHATACLQTLDAVSHPFPLQIGLSHAFVGNAPPTLAGCLLRRVDRNERIPYLLFIFVAGSICFQIWVQSDDMDKQVPTRGKFGVRWISQLPLPEGGYFPVEYSDPIQFDWTSLTPTFQPFGEFGLDFDPRTTNGVFAPRATSGSS